MDSLLGESKQTESRNDLRTSLCYYLSIILVLVAFILSCFSLGFCSSVIINHRESCVGNHPEEDLHLQLPLL